MGPSSVSVWGTVAREILSRQGSHGYKKRVFRVAIKHKGEELKGRAKEAVGGLTHNKKLQLKGKADQALALVKHAGHNVKQKTTDHAAKLKATGLTRKLKGSS